MPSIIEMAADIVASHASKAAMTPEELKAELQKVYATLQPQSKVMLDSSVLIYKYGDIDGDILSVYRKYATDKFWKEYSVKNVFGISTVSLFSIKQANADIYNIICNSLNDYNIYKTCCDESYNLLNELMNTEYFYDKNDLMLYEFASAVVNKFDCYVTWNINTDLIINAAEVNDIIEYKGYTMPNIISPDIDIYYNDSTLNGYISVCYELENPLDHNELYNILTEYDAAMQSYTTIEEANGYHIINHTPQYNSLHDVFNSEHLWAKKGDFYKVVFDYLTTNLDDVNFTTIRNEIVRVVPQGNLDDELYKKMIHRTAYGICRAGGIYP